MTMRLLPIIAITLLAAPAMAGQPTVIVKNKAAVTDPVVRLGDIARIRGFAPDAAAKVAAIELGRAPAVGLGQFMPRAYLEARIREGGLPTGVRLRIPNRVEISRKARTISGEQLGARIRAAIERQMPHAPDDVAEIDIPRLADLKLPDGADIDVRFDPDEAFRGSVVAELVIRDDGQRDRTRRVSTRVEVYETVYGATAALNRGYRMRGADLVELRLPTSQIPRDAVRHPDLIDGAMLKRALQPGEAIRDAWLEVPPLVRRGDRVRMIARRGALQITARGEALAHGTRGELIRVRNLGSGKIVSGQVTAPGVVEMEF